MQGNHHNDQFLEYKFKFVFSNGTEKNLLLKLDKETVTLVRDNSEDLPEWALHENFKCANLTCTLTHKTHCPIAVNLNTIIRFFSEIPSYEKVKIIAEVNDRTYVKETSIQDGVGSVIGIVMSTSGCPTLGKLKPMARFHLPFASIEETEFRVFSMYLLAQYFKMKHGKTPDWNMKHLKDLYEDIQKINQNVASKIADLEKMDTSINAVVILNNFAQSVSFNLDDDDLSSIEYLFKDWIDS